MHVFRLERLTECFFAVRANECIELLTFVGWACNGAILDFNLGLVLYCLSRESLPLLLERWLGTQKGWGKGNFSWIQTNLLILPFFLFIAFPPSQQSSSLLFLLVLANRLFRS